MRLFLAALGVMILACPPGFGAAAEPVRPTPFEANDEAVRRDSAGRLDFPQQWDRAPQGVFRDRPGNPPPYGFGPADDASPKPQAPAMPLRREAMTLGT